MILNSDQRGLLRAGFQISIAKLEGKGIQNFNRTSGRFNSCEIASESDNPETAADNFRYLPYDTAAWL